MGLGQRGRQGHRVLPVPPGRRARKVLRVQGGTLTTTVATSEDAAGGVEQHDTVSAIAECPQSTVLTGGGGFASNSNADEQGSVQLIGSQPEGNGWRATGAANSPLDPGALMVINAYAICTSIT